jgi:hypothetical protein
LLNLCQCFHTLHPHLFINVTNRLCLFLEKLELYHGDGDVCPFLYVSYNNLYSTSPAFTEIDVQVMSRKATPPLCPLIVSLIKLFVFTFYRYAIWTAFKLTSRILNASGRSSVCISHLPMCATSLVRIFLFRLSTLILREEYDVLIFSFAPVFSAFRVCVLPLGPVLEMGLYMPVYHTGTSIYHLFLNFIPARINLYCTRFIFFPFFWLYILVSLLRSTPALVHFLLEHCLERDTSCAWHLILWCEFRAFAVQHDSLLVCYLIHVAKQPWYAQYKTSPDVASELVKHA